MGEWCVCVEAGGMKVGSEEMGKDPGGTGGCGGNRPPPPPRDLVAKLLPSQNLRDSCTYILF